VSEGWSRCPGSNWRPRPYQGRALPTELHRPSPFGLRPTGRPSHLGFGRQVGLLISASADRSAFSSRLRPTSRPSHLGFGRQVGLLISASADKSAFSSRLQPTSRPSHLGFGRQVGLLISASADKSAFSSRLRPTSRLASRNSMPQWPAIRSSPAVHASEGWSGRRGSNPRPTAWKAVTLPLSYSRLRAH
jgi:hypothetical protein